MINKGLGYPGRAAAAYVLAAAMLGSGPICAQGGPIVRFTVTGFEVSGANPLPAPDTERLLAGYAGEYAGLDGLLAAVDAFQAELNRRGHAFRRVVLPPQTLDDGVVRLEIVPITLASVSVAGAKYFSDENVLASVPALRAGITPDRGQLSGALALANRHPAKQLTVRLRESDEPAAVDAVIDVRDRRPWQLFAGLNDIGTRNSGRTRVTVGGQHSNLFDRDHALTVSYTTSPENADDVMQAGASYDLPLYPVPGRLSAFFSESDVNVGEVGGFQITGAGRFFGLSFTRLMARRGAYEHEWSLGTQDRFFESDISNAAFNRFFPSVFQRPDGAFDNGNVRSRPLLVGYAGRYETRSYTGTFGLTFAKNLATGDKNDDQTYAAHRAGADSKWDALRFEAGLDVFLPHAWLGRIEVSGQWADEPLIPGEQFGLGGARSVRGLDERELVADSGVRAGLELWSPPIPRTLGLRVLAFLDLGYFDRADPLPGEINDDTLASVGTGLRWQFRGLSMETDYGYVFDEGKGLTAASEDVNGSRWHFRVFYVY